MVIILFYFAFFYSSKPDHPHYLSWACLKIYNTKDILFIYNAFYNHFYEMYFVQSNKLISELVTSFVFVSLPDKNCAWCTPGLLINTRWLKCPAKKIK